MGAIADVMALRAAAFGVYSSRGATARLIRPGF
jgi:hypothetical protein